MRDDGRSRRFFVDFVKRALFLRNTPKCLFKCLFIRLFSGTNFGGQNEFTARSSVFRDLKSGAVVSSEILVALARALRFQCLFKSHRRQAGIAQGLEKSFTSFLVQGRDASYEVSPEHFASWHEARPRLASRSGWKQQTERPVCSPRLLRLFGCCTSQPSSTA